MLRDSGYCETASEPGGDKGVVGGLSPLIPAPPVTGPEASGSDKDFRITGSSCRALRHAVAALNRLDDFVLEKIGSGFFSEVFKVTHRVTGQVMVLKMNQLRSNRPNMLKEVQLMNQLCHKNILGFMGVCVHEGQLHALTEFINGGSLEQLIQNRSIELTYRVRVKLALDIARGMEYLHSRDVFHRDLTSKNVLIKKDETTGEMTALVGDFGLAAKIPRSGYRLPTVGSPYWMSPECLKGQWYDERSDVFSYGIILCELIARVEADPDILPRTENFGLDYLAFIELCTDPPPSDFLKLAFSCCNFEPMNRPTFSEVVKLLEAMLSPGGCLLPSASPNVPALAQTGSISARSEEFLPTAALPKTHHAATPPRKLIHRRSLSEDVMIVFPPHTAPSDKARCHFMMARPTLKHLGETMAKNDPHYKPFPSRANPFAALSQFKGVKKILASTNSTDLFSSCFELPSPSPYRSKPFELSSVNQKQEPKPPFERGKMFEEETKKEDHSVLLEPAVIPSQIKSKFDTVSSSKSKEQSPTPQSSLESETSTAKMEKLCCASKAGLRCCTVLKTKPRSLPSSPTFCRRNTVPMMSSEFFSRLSARKNQVLSKYSSDEDPLQRIVCDSLRKKPFYDHPLFKPPSANPPTREGKSSTSMQHPLRSCASSSNLACLPDVFPSVSTPVVPLRRRGSCESGFFSSVGEDFCLPGIELVTASSVTLSSSSAASSLFLDSGATVSCSLEDIATPLRGHHPLLPYHKRSSSIYTDSSEDVSSLGGGDLPSWDDRGSQAPQHISKIVEYFERKQVSGSGSGGRWELGDVPSPNLTQHYHLQREYYQSLRRSYLQESGRSGETKPQVRRSVNHRLLICEGAVRSKLQLFDKK